MPVDFAAVTDDGNDLPSTVRKAARAVCQLKTADSRATTATNVAKNLVLTAGHTMQHWQNAVLMLAVYNLRTDRDPNSREVFGLAPRPHGGEFFYSTGPTKGGGPTVETLNDETHMEFAICQARQNRSGDYSGNAPRGFVSVAPPPHGTLAQEQVFLVAHQGVSTPFQVFSIGALTRVGKFFFCHSTAAGHGDSGAPLFDIDGNLIGIHLADPGGVKIACRADKILEAMTAKSPGVWT